MASNQVIRNRQASTTIIGTYALKAGTLQIDLTKPTVVIHDGTTVGGVPLAHEVHTHSSATESVAGFLSASDKAKLDALSSAGGYNTIDAAGTPLTQQSTLNFLGDFAVANNSGLLTTDVSLSDTFKNTQMTQMISFLIALG